jgi:hypothetical protein
MNNNNNNNNNNNHHRHFRVVLQLRKDNKRHTFLLVEHRVSVDQVVRDNLLDAKAALLWIAASTT